MCWSNNIAIPIVLKKPLKVYKTGTSTILDGFISLYQCTWYYKHKVMPTIKINPKFKRCSSSIGFLDELWRYDFFRIYEGYHSYLTKKRAEDSNYLNNIGIFEIPAGATIYVDYEHKEVVSTDIRYLGLLK